MSDKKEFKDFTPIGEDKIAEMNLEISDLWMIKSEDESIYGPFDTSSLQEFSSSNEDLFETAAAFNLLDEQWKPFFKYSKFQRRKPKLVPIQSLMTTDNFLVLLNGNKAGPYSLEEITQMVDEKKIALNVQVSLDEGESWIKLYEHHAFDRRLKRKAEDLPYLPEGDILNTSWETIEQKIAQAKKGRAQEEEDALVGLAFIGHGNDHGQSYNKEEESVVKSNNTTTHSSGDFNLPNMEWLEVIKEKFNFKYIGIGTAAIILVFSAFNSFNASFNNESEIKSVGHEVKTEKTSINNTARNEVKKTSSQKPKKKIARARKYTPKPTARKRQPTRRPASTRNNANRRKTYRQVHKDERFEELDIDDPQVKEELTRELAGDTYGDEYEELSDEQRDFIERANQEGFSEGDYDEMQARDNQYEEISDFE